MPEVMDAVGGLPEIAAEPTETVETGAESVETSQETSNQVIASEERRD